MPCVDECRAKSGSKEMSEREQRRRKRRVPVTRAALIRAAKAAARKCRGRGLTLNSFRRLTGISYNYVYQLFPRGGWPELQRRAGLPTHQPRWPAERLLAELHRLACKLHAVPIQSELEAQGRCSSITFRNRFGSWKKSLQRYRAWLEIHYPHVPWLRKLPKPRPDNLPSPPADLRKRRSCEYGNPLNFRSLGHAPTNELGVIFLFGLVSEELGFLVEALPGKFPDGQALRCIDKRNGRWEHVRIEFEFKSRNFQRHGHDPSQCDLIVCWKHDWPECPLEVLELRKVVGKLAA